VRQRIGKSVYGLTAPARALKRFVQATLDGRRAFAGADSPVLIYQPGKVGSSTVFDAVVSSLPRTPVYHVHFLSDRLADHRRSHVSDGYWPPPMHIYLGEALRTQIRLHPGRPLRIVSLVRDPIAFEVSNIFQNPRLVGGSEQLAALTSQVSRFKGLLEERLASTSNCSYLEEWFDREVKNMLDIDVFATAFDTDRGWQRYQHQSTDMLLLRLEDLSEVAPSALAAFLDIADSIPLDRRNARARAHSGDAYKRILDEIRLDERLVERVYRRRFASHFYSQQQRERLLKKWTGA
jgi:hypothetical protein